eukprot:1254472-Karenia_brevis.AAC.1
MALDSTAFFMKRVKELGLGEHWDALQLKGWTTMGLFGFSANYIPGGSDDSPFVEEVVVPILGTADHPQKAAFRRLFFDSYAMVAADAQRRATGVEDETKPKRLPGAERNVRIDELK